MSAPADAKYVVTEENVTLTNEVLTTELTTSLIPNLTGRDLGNSTYRWDLFASSIDLTGELDLNANGITALADLTFSDSADRSVYFGTKEVFTLESYSDQNDPELDVQLHVPGNALLTFTKDGGATPLAAISMGGRDIIGVRNIQGGITGDLNLDIAAGKSGSPGDISISYDIASPVKVYDGSENLLFETDPTNGKVNVAGPNANQKFQVKRSTGTTIFNINTNAKFIEGVNGASLKLFSDGWSTEVFAVNGSTGAIDKVADIKFDAQDRSIYRGATQMIKFKASDIEIFKRFAVVTTEGEAFLVKKSTGEKIFDISSSNGWVQLLRDSWLRFFSDEYTTLRMQTKGELRSASSVSNLSKVLVISDGSTTYYVPCYTSYS